MSKGTRDVLKYLDIALRAGFLAGRQARARRCSLGAPRCIGTVGPDKAGAATNPALRDAREASLTCSFRRQSATSASASGFGGLLLEACGQPKRQSALRFPAGVSRSIVGTQ